MDAHIGTGEAQVRQLHHSPAQPGIPLSFRSLCVINKSDSSTPEGRGKKDCCLCIPNSISYTEKNYQFHLFYTISFWEHNSFNSQLRLEKLSSHSQKQSANYISIRYCIFPFAIHKFLTAANCGSVEMKIYFLQINILQRCLLE